MKTEEFTVYPEKTGTVRSILDEVKKQVKLAEGGTAKLRLIEVNANRVVRLFDANQAIEDILPMTRQLRAEEIPEDQLQTDPKNDYLLPVAHFQKVLEGGA